MDKEILAFSSTANFTTDASAGHPNLGWLEFVLTDSEPNANHDGIHKEAFTSLIESGIFMPIKVARGSISEGHSGTEPIGTISELHEVEDRVAGKAAVWKKERPEDYEYLREKSAAGEAIDISWEIAYTTAEQDESGTSWIKDPVLLAATIVGNPAYQGRTPVTSVASVNEKTADVDTAELQNQIEALQAQVTELNSTLEVANTELATLREYKETQEKEQAAAIKLTQRLDALGSVGLEYTEAEVADNAAKWLAMSDDDFNLMVSALQKVAQKTASASSNTGVEVPDLGGGDVSKTKLDIVRRGLAELL